MNQGSTQQNALASSGVALLIGVNEYRSFNASGEDDLQGSRNDVLMWHWFCKEVLGLPPANIKMLTSPRLTPGDFGDDTGAVPPESLGEATEAEIRKHLDWLLQWTKDGRAPGLLTFSGHGAWVSGKGPVLCAADAQPSLAGGVLSLRELGLMIAAARAERTMTVVLDCCHVVAPEGQAGAAGIRRSTALPHGGSADDVAADFLDFGVSQRVFLAARPGQHGYQARLGHRVHGALSFALVTAAEQWRATNGALDATHKQLFKRARKVLRSLRMKQSPKLRVPFDPKERSAVRKLPFFGLHAGETTRRPDAPRGSVQIDPSMSNDFCLYTLSLPSGISNPGAGAILSVNNSGNGRDGNIEYWSTTQNFVSALQSATSLTFDPTKTGCGPGNWSSAPAFPVTAGTGDTVNPTAMMPTLATWSASSSTTPTFPTVAFGGSPSTGTYVVVGFTLGDSQVSQVTWYVGSSSTTRPTYAISSTAAATLDKSFSAPTGYTWWQATLTPSNSAVSIVANNLTPAYGVYTSSQLAASFSGGNLFLWNRGYQRSNPTSGIYGLSSVPGSASWTVNPSTLSSGSVSLSTSSGVAAATVSNTSGTTMYLAYVNNSGSHSGQICCANSTSIGGSWTLSPIGGATPLNSAVAPALASDGSAALYVAYVSVTSSSPTVSLSYYNSAATSPAWTPITPPASIPSTVTNVALTWYKGTLYLAAYGATASGSGLSLYSCAAPVATATTNPSSSPTWTTVLNVPPAQPSSVALAGYNGALYLAYVTSGGEHEVTILCQGPNAWNALPQLVVPGVANAVNAVNAVSVAMAGVDGKCLAIALNDASSNMYCNYIA